MRLVGGHEFNHHHAKEDAETAGRVLLAMMKNMKATTLADIFQKIKIGSELFRQYIITESTTG